MTTNPTALVIRTNAEMIVCFEDGTMDQHQFFSVEQAVTWVSLNLSHLATTVRLPAGANASLLENTNLIVLQHKWVLQ